MRVKETIEDIVIYEKIDYIVENISPKELADYLYHNYHDYSLDLEFILGVEEMEENNAEPDFN